MGKQDIILGLTWLCEHNPEVDWQSNKVKMRQCPNHCHTCQNEMNVGCRVMFREADCICACHTGPMPSAGVDMEDIPDLAPNSDDNDDNEEPYTGKDLLEEGDCLFMATIPCEAEFI
jgi:hypothetical protein